MDFKVVLEYKSAPDHYFQLCPLVYVNAHTMISRPNTYLFQREKSWFFKKNRHPMIKQKE